MQIYVLTFIVYVYTLKIRTKQGRPKMKQTETNKLRQDLTPEEKEKTLKIGRIEFKSAGATRKR